MNCYIGIDMIYGLVRSYMCVRKNVRFRQKIEGVFGQYAQFGFLLLDFSDFFGIFRIEVFLYCIFDFIRFGFNFFMERIVNEMSLERDVGQDEIYIYVQVWVNRNRLYSIIYICL